MSVFEVGNINTVFSYDDLKYDFNYQRLYQH